MSETNDQIEKPVVQGRWYPGMPSPNPGGRSKQVAHLQELAREHTPAALAMIVTLMEDAKSSRMTKLACARELLDRAYGKPMQMTEMALVPPASEVSFTALDPLQQLDMARRVAFLLHAGSAIAQEYPHLASPTAETP